MIGSERCEAVNCWSVGREKVDPGKLVHCKHTRPPVTIHVESTVSLVKRVKHSRLTALRYLGMAAEKSEKELKAPRWDFWGGMLGFLFSLV